MSGIFLVFWVGYLALVCKVSLPDLSEHQNWAPFKNYGNYRVGREKRRGSNPYTVGCEGRF
jgi:hypothetical protein